MAFFLQARMVKFQLSMRVRTVLLLPLLLTNVIIIHQEKSVFYPAASMRTLAGHLTRGQDSRDAA